jgi:uncharacterized protein (DUF433 family)
MKPPTINDRARIEGTRITIYDVLTYSEEGWYPSSIAAVLGISTAQVEAALQYVAEHKEEVMKVYRSILARIERGNPPEIEAKRRQSHERLLAKLKELQEQRKGA